MKKFEGCLLLTDVDNTLVANGYINPKAIEKIKHFTQNGGRFTLATGRTYGGTTHVVEQGFVNAPVLCCNGGTIFDFEQGRAVYRKNLLPTDKERIVEILDKFSHVAAEVQDGDDVYLVNDAEAMRWHLEYENIPLKLANARDLLSIPWHKAIFGSRDIKELKVIEEYAKTITFDNVRVLYTSSGLGVEYLEFHPMESTKSQGAEVLKNLLGCTKLYTIGDYYNDIDMLQAGDVSACVIDAPEDVKKVSDYIVCSARDGAVGEFIDIIERLESSK